jgi:hypothetical protein
MPQKPPAGNHDKKWQPNLAYPANAPGVHQYSFESSRFADSPILRTQKHPIHRHKPGIG